MNISTLLQEQKSFFFSGATQTKEFRKEQLQKLRTAILEREQDWYGAFHKDFRKCSFEAYTTEIALVVSEIDFALKHLSSWMKPKRVFPSLLNFPSHDFVYYCPYGVALIISPWNYPLQLTFEPLVGAIAAGNCSVLKPSEMTPNVSNVIEELITTIFPKEYCAVITGGIDASQELLGQQFDKIFFTGSSAVGKIVMKAAAEYLTPLTLELGGKSPCIIDQTANLSVAALRIAWGKFMNAGQTCVAPDFLYVYEKIKERFIIELQHAIKKLYGVEPKQSPDFPRIINEKHFLRITALMKEGKIVHGGETDSSELYIAPTVLDGITWSDGIMQEEIFGPLLPIISFTDLNDVVQTLQSKSKPLSLYYFGESKETQERILRDVPSGGACINDTVVHFINPHLPIGGVGNSGSGNYHGEASFKTFSHLKSVLKKPTWIDLPIRYAPYKNKLPLLKWIFKLI
ncbi:MAG: aldehyde dehydrogenase (NAD+), partial [Stygiobacter sp.]